jgi:phospholipid transport system substrate-binding protein
MIAGSFAVAGAVPVMAQSAAPSPGVSSQIAAEQGSPAGQFISKLGDQALAVIADRSLQPDQRKEKYRDILNNSFDMPTIGHFVLGRAWNTATPDQQQKYMQLFTQMVLNIYGDRLNFYSGENFKVSGVRQENNRDSVVSSEISHPNGQPPTKIDWRVRQENGRLAVIDVSIEGVSQSVTQRQEFADILEHNNNNIDGLLDMMSKKVQQEGTSPTTSQTSSTNSPSESQ